MKCAADEKVKIQRERNRKQRSEDGCEEKSKVCTSREFVVTTAGN